MLEPTDGGQEQVDEGNGRDDRGREERRPQPDEVAHDARRECGGRRDGESMKRVAELTRPSRWSGVSAWIRLAELTSSDERRHDRRPCEVSGPRRRPSGMTRRRGAPG